MQEQHPYAPAGFVPPALTEQEADTTTRMTIDELNALEREVIEAQHRSPTPGMDTLEEEVRCCYWVVFVLNFACWQARGGSCTSCRELQGHQVVLQSSSIVSC